MPEKKREGSSRHPHDNEESFEHLVKASGRNQDVEVEIAEKSKWAVSLGDYPVVDLHLEKLFKGFSLMAIINVRRVDWGREFDR